MVVVGGLRAHSCPRPNIGEKPRETTITLTWQRGEEAEAGHRREGWPPVEAVRGAEDLARIDEAGREASEAEIVAGFGER